MCKTDARRDYNHASDITLVCLKHEHSKIIIRQCNKDINADD